MNLWLLVPAPRSRVDEVRALVKMTETPPNRAVVVTTQPDPIEPADVAGLVDTVLDFGRPDMLFGEWLNLGLDHIATQVRSGDRYEVACLSSDAQCTDADLAILVDALRGRQLAMVGPDLNGRVAPGDVMISRSAAGRDVFNRIHGAAFVIAGELGLRFDPQFRWWYSDDDFETQHRHASGVGLVGGTSLRHDDHPPSAEAQAWAVEDRARYVAKWHHQPW